VYFKVQCTQVISEIDMLRVSVIIPCYNQGRFVDEAVDSVLSQSYQDLEIIVVNDGSTDNETNSLLGSCKKPKTTVITTENQGLAAARNNGIAIARGDYILPLDADDKIEPTYIAKAVDILDRHPDIGIVYCRAMLFGQVETEWLLPDYSLDEMLIDNIIFCSALFRKQDWFQVGGYDTGMIYGWEDYEFWLSLIELGREVHKIPEPLFFYRVASDSMVRSKEKSQKISMFKRIFERHSLLFHQHIDIWINRLLSTKEKYYTARLYIDSGNGISDTESVARKVGKDTFRLVFDVSSFHKIVNLRFDPIDTYAVLTIHKIIMKKKDGVELAVEQVTCNESYKDEGRLLFTTEDPQCFFTVDQTGYDNLNEVLVELSYQAQAEDALVFMLQYQGEMIKEMREKSVETRGVGIAKVIWDSLKRNG
jgi:glycosyltransferase involved in cell wall biosynthesis